MRVEREKESERERERERTSLDAQPGTFNQFNFLEKTCDTRLDQ